MDLKYKTHIGKINYYLGITIFIVLTLIMIVNDHKHIDFELLIILFVISFILNLLNIANSCIFKLYSGEIVIVKIYKFFQQYHINLDSIDKIEIVNNNKGKWSSDWFMVNFKNGKSFKITFDTSVKEMQVLIDKLREQGVKVVLHSSDLI